MKKTIFFLFFIFFVGQLFAQSIQKETLLDRNEIYIQIALSELTDANREFIQVDQFKGTQVTAYVQPNYFNENIKNKLDYQLATPPSMRRIPQMAAQTSELTSTWDYYPTYSQYVEMMNEFVQKYPDLCTIENFGQSVEGRDLLAVKISDNVTEKENEPEFFYSATMHGDELVGYILMLRLIDYLLSNYGINEQVTRLIDGVEIWINPLANPDGTYAGGNSTIYGATRANANGLDLNRNFPDPEEGEFPNGDRQPETQLMMDFMDKHRFVVSANLHSGMEVINYPWDTWQERHADDDWFQYISRQYADVAHTQNSSYMTSFNNGITNGYDWYSISGGRQDYISYFKQGREITLELSIDKVLPASSLPDYWTYNYLSLLDLIEESTFGIFGQITDQQTNEPIEASVHILDHDFAYTSVRSNEQGYFYRPIKEGTYSIEVAAQGYENKIITDISVLDKNGTEQNISLQPGVSSISPILSKMQVRLSPNPCHEYSKVILQSSKKMVLTLNIVNLWGEKIKSYTMESSVGENEFIINTESLISGIYFCIIENNERKKSLILIKR